MISISVGRIPVHRLRWMFILGMVMTVHIKDAEPDSSICKISPNGHFYGCKPVIGERIGSSDDRKHVDSRRKPPNGIDFRRG